MRYTYTATGSDFPPHTLQHAVHHAMQTGNLTAAYVYSRMLARHALDTLSLEDRIHEARGARFRALAEVLRLGKRRQHAAADARLILS